jgi:hypothetical protein
MGRRETLALYKKHFRRWSYMIEHYGWKLTVCYCDSSDDMPGDAIEGCAGYAVSRFKYLDATIYINLKASDEQPEREIEYVVIHELVHLLTSPMMESAESTPVEYTVTSIARVLQGLRMDK